MWFTILVAGVLVVFLLNVGVGSADITVGQILEVLFGKPDPSEKVYLIIWRIRLPRAMAGLAGGAALAISGLLLQTYFSNPIVEPYVLGISSGSSLFVGLVMLGGVTFGFQRVTPVFLFIGAFLGAMAVMLVILFASTRVKSIVTLLIVGLMAGYICSAVTSILSAYAEREQIAGFTHLVIVPIRQVLDKLIRPHHPGSFHHLFIAGIQPAVTDVFHHAALKEMRNLLYVAQIAVDPL